jgi:hypothetical protein
MTINDSPVNWGVFLLPYSVVSYFESNFGTITDWDAICPADTEGKESNNDYLTGLSRSCSPISMFWTFRRGSGRHFERQDRQMTAKQRQGYRDYGGGDEAAFEKYLEGYI